MEIQLLGPIEKAGLALMITVIMLGMGATLSWQDFLAGFKKPKAVIIGLFSQFFFMPFIAFALASGLDLSNPVALSLILIGTTPGGTTSNLFAYYARGDVAASITMTVASTLLATILMPLSLSIYAKGFTDASLQIPFTNIISTLVLILIPVAIGMYIRKRSLGAALKMETIASHAGVLIILFLILETLIKNTGVFKTSGAKQFIAAISLGLAGFLLGFLLAKLFKLSTPLARTISLETGIQNTPLTIAIIVLSFPDTPAIQNQMLTLPILYAVFIVITSLIVSWTYRKLSER